MKAKEPRLDGSYRRQDHTKRVPRDPVERPAASRRMVPFGASYLHDSTGQHLIAASLNVMRLRRALCLIDSTEKICDDIDASIDQALKEIRAFTYLLHPQHLLADGLKTTIERYVEGFSVRTSLKSTLAIDPEIDRLSYETQRSLLRVVQEALTNVFRHAKATQVEITIKATESNCRLRVSDDGCGMPIGRERSRSKAISFGVGIPGMSTRVHELGGTFEIRSSPATECPGTTVCVQIPYRFGRKQAPVLDRGRTRPNHD
jgi:two-component system, NarL family, sensor kinase